MSPVRRWLGLSAVILVSVLVPAAIVVWAIYLFQSSLVESYGGEAIRDGKLWYVDAVWPAGSFVWGPTDEQQPLKSRLHCRDLKTGQDNVFPMTPEVNCYSLLWVGNELYGIGDDIIYRFELDSSGIPSGRLVTLAPLPKITSNVLNHDVTVIDGELTTIAETTDGGMRLVHLRGGNWIDGKRFRLPSPDSEWMFDQTRGKWMIQPSVSPTLPGVFSSAVSVPSGTAGTLVTFFAPPSAAQTMWWLRLRQQGDTIHAFYGTMDGFHAYRNGLEFEDDPPQPTSAFDVENVLHDAHGWEHIFMPGYENFLSMEVDRFGPLFVTSTQIFRKAHGGQMLPLVQGEGPTQMNGFRVALERDTGTTFVNTSLGDLLRVDQDSVQLTGYDVPDDCQLYLSRWIRLCAMLFAAWVAHFLIVMLGSQWLAGGAARATYEFGILQATQASIARRTIACLMDVFLSCAAIGVSLIAHCWISGLHYVPAQRMTLVQALEMFGWSFELGSSSLSEMLDAGMEVLRTLVFGETTEDTTFAMVFTVFAVVIDTGFVLWLFKAFEEGKYGASPGKWLMSIRTRRSTLRPCGMARAMVRDLFLVVDLCCLMTPIPAAISFVFSSARQRLGDHVADTVVVTAGTSASNP